MELCDTTYTFELDNIGNVIGIEKSTLTTTEELEINDRFSIFPNPTSGILNIKDSGASQNYQIEIYKPTGELIHSGSNESKINLSSISEGLYYIRIKDKTSSKFYSSRIYLLD